jgi:hypothetical protein
VDISSSVNGQVVGSCESGNGPSSSIQGGEIFWIGEDTLAYQRGLSSSAARFSQGVSFPARSRPTRMTS